jgi:uncharacterized protein (TIGR02996 family)
MSASETEAGFLRSIWDDPEDDAPRLVYADWLDDRGEAARAEFIRTQVRLARLAPDDPARPGLEQRERQLLTDHADAWLGPLASPRLHWQFRRGFVEGLGHTGVFRHPRPFHDGEGVDVWGYLRFYPDGTVLHVTTNGTPAQIVPWFHRGPQTLGRQPLPHANYRVRHAPPIAVFTFTIRTGYGAGFGEVHFEGVMGGKDLLPRLPAEESIAFEVRYPDRAPAQGETYRLVDEPAFDSRCGS